jgi:hypothetical protein
VELWCGEVERHVRLALPLARRPSVRTAQALLQVRPALPATMQFAKSRPQRVTWGQVATKPPRISIALPVLPKATRRKSAPAAWAEARWRAWCCRRQPQRRPRLDAAHRKCVGCAPGCRGALSKPVARQPMAYWSRMTYVWRVSGRAWAAVTPFCDSGSWVLPRQPPRSTFVRRSTPFGNVLRASAPALGSFRIIPARWHARAERTSENSLGTTSFTRWHKFSPVSTLIVRVRIALLANDTRPETPHSLLSSHLDCRRSRGRAIRAENDIEQSGRLAGYRRGNLRHRGVGSRRSAPARRRYTRHKYARNERFGCAESNPRARTVCPRRCADAALLPRSHA